LDAQNECLKKTWKRVGDGLRICLNKKDCESSLDELKGAIHDLTTIMEQVSKMQKPSRAVTKKRTATTSLYWTDIRRASKTLHDALVDAWSCTQAQHARHSVKLFVEAQKADDGVQMDIAILCHGYEHSTGKVDMIRLQVRSTLMVLAPRAQFLVPPSCGHENRSRKRVRFDADDDSKPSPTDDEKKEGCPEDELRCPPSADLRCSADFCLELTTRCGQKVTTKTCFGHLDITSEDGYRHQFFPASLYAGRQLGVPSAVGTKDLIPMNTILGGPTGDSFSTVDKLKMAKALVLAVLKFHATPWLGEAWRLQDLAFFHYSQDLARSLQTLHVGVDFEHEPPRETGRASASPCPEGEDDSVSASFTKARSPFSQASEDERLSYGIANTTLHCLGVALLQIDRSTHMDPEEVLTVRKTAKMTSSLGPKYKELVEKCLWCDFGLGGDLGKTQLQKAVYECVVDVLEGMIAVLDINDDDHE
jgi:hypothetical protein